LRVRAQKNEVRKRALVVVKAVVVLLALVLEVDDVAALALLQVLLVDVSAEPEP